MMRVKLVTRAAGVSMRGCGSRNKYKRSGQTLSVSHVVWAPGASMRWYL